MKKKFYLICLSLVFLTTFYSCEKDPISNGSLNITVHYHNQPVAGAKVYFKMGVYTNPDFTDSQYDGILTTDGSGITTFSNRKVLYKGHWIYKPNNSTGGYYCYCGTPL